MHRDEIVKTISTFYTFLVTNTLLPTTAIKTPPSKGWPEEYRQAFRKMGKSEEVVDLLSHLPYIDDPNWEWLNETKPINYISSLNLRRLNGDYESKRYLFEPSEFKFPSHVVSLTTGRLYGSWLLLDLHAGKFLKIIFRRISTMGDLINILIRYYH